MAMRIGDGRGGPVSEINVTPFVCLKADADASYGAVMTVMDRLHDAHIDTVGLITRTPPVPAGATPGGL